MSKRLSVKAGEVTDGLVRRARHVPVAVAREVYLRDGGRCTFCGASGKRCAGTWFVELDHIIPWAEGGESTAENLRLRCREDNQHSARKHFGADFVNAAIRARRARLNTGESSIWEAASKKSARDETAARVEA